MEKVAIFEKVSVEQFKKDLKDCGLFLENEEELLEELLLPSRATVGSAGYDFRLPFYLKMEPGQSERIPTGIRVRIREGWVLQIFPRSSLGFKYRLQLDNTVGIIDSDYYHAANEGHIIVKLTNHSDRVVELKRGDRFVQGIFLAFGIVEDDEAGEKRKGGFGSTN